MLQLVIAFLSPFWEEPFLHGSAAAAGSVWADGCAVVWEAGLGLSFWEEGHMNMWVFEERLFSLLDKGLGVGWWGPNTKCCSGIGYWILPTHLLWIRAPPCPVCPASVIPAVAGFSNLRHAGGVQCEHMYFIRHFLMMKGITHVYTQLLTIRLGALSSCLLSEFQIFFLFKKLFPPALLVSFYAFIILSMIYSCIYYISIYLFTIFYQLNQYSM